MTGSCDHTNETSNGELFDYQCDNWLLKDTVSQIQSVDMYRMQMNRQKYMRMATNKVCFTGFQLSNLTKV